MVIDIQELTVDGFGEAIGIETILLMRFTDSILNHYLSKKLELMRRNRFNYLNYKLNNI